MSTTLDARGGRPVTAKTVHPQNVYLARVQVQRYNATTDAFEPWSNTTATVSFATDERGTAPIAGMTNIPLDPVSGAAGVYAQQVQTNVMNLLLPYVGQTVYQITRIGEAPSDAQVVTPLVVRVPRYAQ
jgi:hypothetical protein